MNNLQLLNFDGQEVIDSHVQTRDYDTKMVKEFI